MQKSEYRRFNMRDLTPGDDYAAMRQALSRRYERVMAGEGKLPDLILIDGGRGQLNAARAALAELGLNDVTTVGVAKGAERKAGMEELVLEAEGQSLALPPQHAGLHLIQSIRDEAHRFAITYHRSVRSRTAMASVFDEVAGIGPVRKKALLKRFGSLRRIREASVDELAETPGITRSLAENLKRHLAREGMLA